MRCSGADRRALYLVHVTLVDLVVGTGLSQPGDAGSRLAACCTAGAMRFWSVLRTWVDPHGRCISGPSTHPARSFTLVGIDPQAKVVCARGIARA